MNYANYKTNEKEPHDFNVIPSRLTRVSVCTAELTYLVESHNASLMMKSKDSSYHLYVTEKAWESRYCNGEPQGPIVNVYLHFI